MGNINIQKLNNMKKLFLLLGVISLQAMQTASAQADTIYNPGFEKWTPNPLVAAYDPNAGNSNNGWWEFNVLNFSLLGGTPITVFRDSVKPLPEQGKYYARIVSNVMTEGNNGSYALMQKYGFPYPDTNGLLFTGYVSASGNGLTVRKGYPFVHKMKSFSFYYRYIPNGTDSCFCLVSLSTAGKVIGTGSWYANTKQTSWTSATVNVTYTAQTAPDSIFILYSACSLKSKPKPYDTMDLDGTSNTILGIDNITAEQDNVNLYPNPANTQINLAVTGQYQASKVEVYDISGKSIGTYAIRNNFLSINTQSYTNGLYLYRLLDDNGTQLNVGKFSIVK